MEELFGPYRLVELIGRGGMGEVFRAHDTRRDRVVALKRLPLALAADPEFRERFRRESALVARLREPHIIPIHDYGEIDGTLFIDMRLVDGTDLGAVIKAGALPAPRAVDVISQVADALDSAHAEGLVHRDVKPSNVLLLTRGDTLDTGGRDFAYLVDFGIARALDATGISQVGLHVGTSAYMAPERFEDGAWDHRVDVYSLTCVLYECLTGLRPYRVESLGGMIHAHLHAEPPRPSLEMPGLAGGFDAVIATGLAKKLADRYPTAGELAAAARAVLVAAAPSRSAVAPRARPETLPRDRQLSPSTGASSTPRPSVPGSSSPTTPISGNRSQPAPVSPPGIPGPPPARWTSPLAGAGGGRSPMPGFRRSLLVVTALAGVVAVVLTITSWGTGPETVSVDAQPLALAVTADGSSLYVASGGTGTLTLVSTETNSVVGAPVPIGAQPDSLQLSRDGRRLYVAAATSGAISVVDTESQRPIGGPIPVGGQPRAMALSPDGSRLYVATLTPEAISVVDIAAGPAVVGSIQVGAQPVGLAAGPDGSTLYVTTHDPDGVVVLDTAGDMGIIDRIQVGVQPAEAAASPDGGRLYVTNQGSDSLSVVETASGLVIRVVPVGDAPTGVAVSPDGRRVYVTNADSDTVSVIDAVTNSVIGEPAEVGDRPVDVTVSPNGETLYVANQGGNSVSSLPA